MPPVVWQLLYFPNLLSQLAIQFGTVGSEQDYIKYTKLTLTKLTRTGYGSPLLMGHGFWGMHMRWGELYLLGAAL